ncbi:serine/threonine-protein kinase TNNI3K isoform X6 [Thraustotheca clavata]|uniref:Serine/threonine-protein kinase TNNI3K isoform X6 n=1 Tax=Thraustotheca clavata TaxID=74557 RepID=A0A1W0AC89_9STRA|nr:serine/threonine-protein kinase TNNI3K isoform X6 [Thraustotheca clavata]
MSGTDLFDAASGGNLEQVKSLLTKGVNCNSYTNQVGDTSLYVAAENGHKDVVSTLINAGANIHQGGSYGWTPLLIAAENGHKDIVSVLINAGSNINQADYYGETPLLAAADNGHKDVVSQQSTMLDKKSIKDIVSVLIDAGSNINQVLINVGSNINQADYEGATPLHLAAENGHKQVVTLLLEAKVAINCFTKKGETALYVAAKLGHTDIVSILLQANADLEISDNNGLTPQMIALKNSHQGAANLLQNAAQSKREEKSRIINAINSGNITQLKLLLAKHIDPNILYLDNSCLLHVVIQNKQLPIFQIILKTLAISGSISNNDSEIPLTLAIKSGNRQLVRIIYAMISEPMQYIENEDIKIDYKHCLGSGGFGIVYKGKYKNETVAIKTLQKNVADSSEIQKEIETMQCCSPYVLRLIGVNQDSVNEPKLVLEYMDGGDLRSYLDKKQKNLPITTTYSSLEIAWVIVNGLADIHQCGCIHRDLKSKNVLLSSKNYIKIADLGLTRDVASSMTQGACTLYWIAPEVLNGGRYDCAADIYSFGVVLTELDTLESPYSRLGLNPYQILDGVRNGTLRPSVSTTCSSWYKDLVDKCLLHDPSERPTALEIVDIIQANLFSKSTKQQNIAKNVNSQVQISEVSSSSSTFPSSKSLSSSMLSLSSTLGVTDLRCSKCKEPNSLLHQSCKNCNNPLPKDDAKIRILMRRVENANLSPVCLCLVCENENQVTATHCEFCDEELFESNKVNSLVSLLQLTAAP